MPSHFNSKGIERTFRKAQDNLVLQSSDLSLATLAEMVEKKAIIIDPKYQRRERWARNKQSALIESFILNIPVPPIYLAEDDYGEYAVIDGKQRLIAINEFMKHEMKLIQLAKFTELEGAEFSDLPNPIQNALNIRPYVRVIILLKQTDENLKYEVFTRLNKGGEPLLPQEIRNVAYRGLLNDLVMKLAENNFLKQQLKIKDNNSKPYRLMIDAEFVLRYFTLLENWKDFSGVMRLSMDNYMKLHQSEPEDFISTKRKQFNRAIDACAYIWGENAFKRPDKGIWRNLVLSGMYDAQMLSVTFLTDNEINKAKERKRQVINGTIWLFENNQRFVESVRQFTSNPDSIKYRIQTMTNFLKNISK